MSERIDYVTRSFERLPSQYKQSENMISWIGIFMSQLNDLENTFHDIQELRYLPIAQGDQLDGLGEIIGESRSFDAALRYFGMKGNDNPIKGYITLSPNGNNGALLIDGDEYFVSQTNNNDPTAADGDRYRVSSQALSLITGAWEEIPGGTFLIWDDTGSSWTSVEDSQFPLNAIGGFGDQDNFGEENPEAGIFADERYGTDGTQRFILSDLEYRGLLQAKIVWNYTNCSDSDVIQSMKFLLHDPDVRIIIAEDFDNLVVTITIDKVLTPREKLIVLSPKAPIPKQGGIAYTYRDVNGPL